MAHEYKDLMLKELEAKFREINQTGCVLVDYQGAKADQTRKLRSDIRKKGAEMTVVRNSLFGLAMAKLGVADMSSVLRGPVAVVCADDPVTAARAVDDVVKAGATIRIKGAYVDGRLLGPDVVTTLATMGTREELLARVAGVLMAPLQRLAGGLLTKPQALARLLTQLKEKTATGPAPA